MRDAFGGIVNISMIVVFLVVVSGYLAFNVTYTKAFRMKNKIITTLEQYEGCQQGTNEETCVGILEDYANSIGYVTPNKNYCTKDDGEWTKCTNKYAWKEMQSGTGGDNTKHYYNVRTIISIQIPIIEKIMSNMDVFYLNGSTKLMRK